MKTYILEGIVTATTSICHNGGEKNGTVTQLRREKFVQPNGKTVEVPIISGNSIRGKLRDLAAIEILTKENGEKIEVDPQAFNLLFSGGSLESGGGALDLDKIRQMRKDMPMLSVLGGSVGNIILPGKVEIGKLIPIAKETLHLIPEKYHNAYNGEAPKSVWEYCQLEMYTRKDDSKDEHKREFLQDAEKQEGNPTQMKYDTETIAAGTKFYWRVCLKDTSDVETGAFIKTLNTWAEQNSQIGGNGRVGHGALSLQIVETKSINSQLDFKNSDFVAYVDAYSGAKKDVSEYFEKGHSKTLFK